MYAVIDLETTGLRTGWHDRVVEIAIVLMDDAGHVSDEWCSLINPDRDLGPQHIHGISAAEVRRAPRFEQVAGHVGGLLAGRVVVAHNLAFDAMFLVAEFRRLGVEVPVGSDAGLCTMRLASRFLPGSGRSLHDCRRVAGMPAHHAHSAWHDARAAGDLLAYYLDRASKPTPWAALAAEVRVRRWPDLPTGTATAVQRAAAGHREPHFLTRLIDRLPRVDEPRSDAYLDLLDRALVDRHISATEADALVEAAEALGLVRADVERIHLQYLRMLATIALSDGVLTQAERRDLHDVAMLTGLTSSAVGDALKHAAECPADRTAQPWRLRLGDRVVFTGDMSPPREDWQAEARDVGLDVGDSVTKKTALLVAADPDTMSGKAKKARAYGIPIVRPSAYRAMIETLAGPG